MRELIQANYSQHYPLCLIGIPSNHRNENILGIRNTFYLLVKYFNSANNFASSSAITVYVKGHRKSTFS